MSCNRGASNTIDDDCIGDGDGAGGDSIGDGSAMFVVVGGGEFYCEKVSSGIDKTQQWRRQHALMGGGGEVDCLIVGGVGNMIAMYVWQQRRRRLILYGESPRRRRRRRDPRRLHPC